MAEAGKQGGPYNSLPMLRLLAGLCAAATLVAGTSIAPVAAQGAAPPEVPDRLRAYSIVPPGQDGTFGTVPPGPRPHFDDQRSMYASLVNDDDVSEDELGDYFHSMQFGTGEVARAYEVAEGATVYRDDFGIPHIYADSVEQASFALGYVSAEDRLWEMDVFRHAARGRLAEFVGPGENDAYLTMDIDTRRNGYTAEEVQAMLDGFDDKFGEVGARVQAGLQAYADGVNAYLAEVTGPARAADLPAEYAATQNVPAQWSPLDTLYLAILQLRVFGETAGNELQNAAFYKHLTARLGRRLGTKVYGDLLRQNDPRSPTTIEPSETNFVTQRLGAVDPRSVAVPDNAGEIAASVAAAEAARRRVLASFGFRAPASNALLVSGAESSSGNPLQIGAPQVGYAVPSFFMDVDVHVPGEGVHFRGPAVPGASALIPLGRGVDYAWSLTTGYSDAVDTRAELLCDPAGGEVAADSTSYVFRGECREMESRTETFIVKPTPTSPGAPQVRTETIYRTVHGPVVARGTVGGDPVAFVKQRFFWMRELDSIPQFYRWNTGVHSVEDFAAAARDFTMSFNAFYADADHIAYFHVGFYPRRARHTSPSLPVWGTGEWEWRGRRPFAKQPQVIDPDIGWVANWNNKPAVGWDAYDGFKWGRINRVALLKDDMHALLDGAGAASLSDIVDVIRNAATRDARAVYLGPEMVNAAAAAAAPGTFEAQAVGEVGRWIDAGAHRYNRDGDDVMDDSAALAIFDRWYEKLAHAIFDDELGEDGYILIGAPVTDYTPEAGSSFWFDFSSYIRNLFDPVARDELAHDYCDDLDTAQAESCPDLAAAALAEALEELRAEGGDDPAAWEVPAENIVFTEFGAGSVDAIPWQNRGTHNQVVEVLPDS